MVLEKVVEYMQYWYAYREKEDVPDMHIPVDICLELLQAADFLGMDREWPSSAAIMPPQLTIFVRMIVTARHGVTSQLMLACSGVLGEGFVLNAYDQ